MAHAFVKKFTMCVTIGNYCAAKNKLWTARKENFSWTFYILHQKIFIVTYKLFLYSFCVKCLVVQTRQQDRSGKVFRWPTWCPHMPESFWLTFKIVYFFIRLSYPPSRAVLLFWASRLGGLPSLLSCSVPAIIWTLCCRPWRGISYSLCFYVHFVADTLLLVKLFTSYVYYYVICYNTRVK